MVPTATKRLWLRRAYSETTAGGGSTYTTLEEALQAYAFAASDNTQVGTIASTSINGHSVAFSNRDNGSTPEDVAGAWSDLLDLYDLSVIRLSGTPSDAQIKDEMMYQLVALTSFTGDYSTALRESGGVSA
jgi:hypothetical protein